MVFAHVDLSRIYRRGGGDHSWMIIILHVTFRIQNNEVSSREQAVSLPLHNPHTFLAHKLFYCVTHSPSNTSNTVNFASFYSPLLPYVHVTLTNLLIRVLEKQFVCWKSPVIHFALSIGLLSIHKFLIYQYVCSGCYGCYKKC